MSKLSQQRPGCTVHLGPVLVPATHTSYSTSSQRSRVQFASMTWHRHLCLHAACPCLHLYQGTMSAKAACAEYPWHSCRPEDILQVGMYLLLTITCFGKGRVSVLPLWLMVMKPSSMSMLGVPYSPMVPSFTRWHSGASSCIHHQPSFAQQWRAYACSMDKAHLCDAQPGGQQKL